MAGALVGHSADADSPHFCYLTLEVVVIGLPFKWGDSQLVELMQQAGTVVGVRIPQDDLGRSRGWGTVLFGSPEVLAPEFGVRY